MTISEIFEQRNKKVPEWTLQDRLRKSREDAGLTQAKLGEYMDLTYKQIGNVERGTTPIDGPMLILWAAITEVRLSWLRTGAHEPTDDPNGPDGGLPLLDLDSNQEPIGSCSGSNVVNFTPRNDTAIIDKRAA